MCVYVFVCCACVEKPEGGFKDTGERRGSGSVAVPVTCGLPSCLAGGGMCKDICPSSTMTSAEALKGELREQILDPAWVNGRPRSGGGVGTCHAVHIGYARYTM